MTTCCRCKGLTICCCIHEMTPSAAAAEWEYRRTERLGMISGARFPSSFEEIDQAESEIPEIINSKRKEQTKKDKK